jgi:hypothetical protein
VRPVDRLMPAKKAETVKVCVSTAIPRDVPNSDRGSKPTQNCVKRIVGYSSELNHGVSSEIDRKQIETAPKELAYHHIALFVLMEEGWRLSQEL